MRHAYALLLALCLCGCAASVPATWVAADRARFDSVGSEYRTYYAADPSLSPDDKARRDRTMSLWQKDLEEHEAAVKAGNP
jgi:hypothetical protein